MLAAGTPERMTLDDMTLVCCHDSAVGAWASKVLAREDDKILDELLAGGALLPRGMVEDRHGEEVCIGLLSSAGAVWTPEDGWNSGLVPCRSVDLDEAEVAFFARAGKEGYGSVLFRPIMPMAFIAAPAPPTPAAPAAKPVELPSDAKAVAVVDPVDKSAVLELLAIAPGPTIYRRNDGGWYIDGGWIPVLTAVHPPTMVVLTPAQLDSVVTQVDQATHGVKFAELAVKDRALYQAVQASGYLGQLQCEGADQAIALSIALVAVAGRELSPSDVKNTERLKRYWTVGPGALKIRWGTPGSHTRCVRHLRKYVGPLIVHGLCTNLGQRLGGYGVADHVGAKL